MLPPAIRVSGAGTACAAMTILSSIRRIVVQSAASKSRNGRTMLTCPECGGIVELTIIFGHGNDTIPEAECTECQARWNTYGEKK